MTKALYKMNFFSKVILKFLKAITLSKFFFIFTLRQGTIMIASVELSLTTFAMILLLLCLTHANHLVDMVAAEIQQFENHIWYLKGDNGTPTYVFGNEKKMLIGQHLAVILKGAVSVLLFVTTIYFISSVLLMYGAIRRSPKHLLPWTSIAFVTLTTVFWLLPVCYFVFDNYCAIACLFLFVIYPLQIYAWLTVFNYYRQLTYKPFDKVENTYIVNEINHLQMMGTGN